MNTLEEHIFCYADLSEAEQRAVEERVAGRPKYQTLLDEVKRLEMQLRSVQLPDASAPESDWPDAVLALYALHTASQTQEENQVALQQFFAEVEVRLDDDAALRSRVQPMIERAQALNDSFDVGTHFESTTGFDLDALPTYEGDSMSESDLASGSAGAAWENGEQGAGRSTRPPADPEGNGSTGRHRISEQVWGAARYVAIAMVSLLVVYGGLLTVSTFMQSPAEQMAAIDPDETEIEGYQVRTRSATANEPTSADERFLQALEALQEAHYAPLGLFPQFDQERVQEAQDLLRQVVESEDSGSFLQLEASFFLAKTYLAQSDIEPAREALKRVVMGEGRRIDEATQMLETLQAEYPMEAPTPPDDAQL